MLFSKVVRSKLVKGVSLLGVIAVAGLGLSGLGSNGQPEEMRSKTDLELEILSDPLFEELFEDKYHRALEEYTGSKGLFSCDETCQVHKRRLNIVSRELNAIQQERGAARKAALARARDVRLAAAAVRKAEAAERSAFAQLANEDRIAVRKSTRKAERDAERAAAIVAHRLQLGMPAAPLTLEEKQARAAAAKAARIANREARISPQQRSMDAQANRDALWLEYLNEVAAGHGFSSWESVEEFLVMTPEERADLVQGNQEDGMYKARLNVRTAVRQAANRTPAPTPSPTDSPTPAPTPSPTGPEEQYEFISAAQDKQCPAGHEITETECIAALDGLLPRGGTTSWEEHWHWYVAEYKHGLPCGCTLWKRRNPAYYTKCEDPNVMTHSNTELVCRKNARN